MKKRHYNYLPGRIHSINTLDSRVSSRNWTLVCSKLPIDSHHFEILYAKLKKYLHSDDEV